MPRFLVSSNWELLSIRLLQSASVEEVLQADVADGTLIESVSMHYAIFQFCVSWIVVT
jgi:hypothetical protein